MSNQQINTTPFNDSPTLRDKDDFVYVVSVNDIPRYYADTEEDAMNVMRHVADELKMKEYEYNANRPYEVFVNIYFNYPSCTITSYDTNLFFLLRYERTIHSLYCEKVKKFKL